MSALRKAFLAVVILALICAIAYEILKPLRNSNGLATLKDQSDENAGEQRMPEKFAEDTDDKVTDTQLREYAAQADANIEFIERMPEGESRVSIPLKSALLTTSRTQVQKWEFVFDTSSVAGISSPEVKFVVTFVSPNADGSIVQWDLTIKDITKTITFPAKIGVTDEKILFVTDFFVDKTMRWIAVQDATSDKMMGFSMNVELPVR